MKPRVMYIELKTGFDDDGPARIGRVTFSKTGQTIFYDGKTLRRRQGTGSNHYDVDTGEEYWISGVKKSGDDGHGVGSGAVEIDDDAREEYEQVRARR